MKNDKLGVHFASGNGTGRHEEMAYHLEKEHERARNLKFAIFCLAVGVLLFLANQFAKQPQADGKHSNPLSNVGFDLSVSRKPEPTSTANDRMAGATYVIRFRLANRANESVWYPVYPGTNHPVGHLVYRVAPSSEWVVLPWPKEPTLSSAGGKVAWVEMPPGGWLDGNYDDPGSPHGDHAYELDLKLASSDNVVRFVSQAYRVSTN